MTATPHAKQMAAALEIIREVGIIIQTVGQIPSGELYAQLMGHMSIETYENMIALMERSNLIRRERSHLLVWIGPKAVK